MRENSKARYIPPLPPKRETRVAIYARVSTNSADQLKSLSEQVSHFTQLTSATPQWLLVDIYMDVSSSKPGSFRREFNRMLEDCRSHKMDIILTKSISRFGRDTVECLDVLNKLKLLEIRVIFEAEGLDTAIIESLTQFENESRSESIKLKMVSL